MFPRTRKTRFPLRGDRWIPLLPLHVQSNQFPHLSTTDHRNASKLSRSMNKVTRLVIESSNRVSAIKRDEEGEGERKEGREKERKSEFKDNIYGREDRWT